MLNKEEEKREVEKCEFRENVSLEKREREKRGREVCGIDPRAPRMLWGWSTI